MGFTSIPTPCYIVDERKLIENLKILRGVEERTGAKILLAQKAFSMFSVYPLMREYLAGTAASGLYEARLGHERFGGETHVYSPAYPEREFKELLKYADHVIFNSFSQWEKYGGEALAAQKSCGLRLNPECSTQPEEHAKYDPCAPGSRLGVRFADFKPEQLEGIDGFHIHTLCEQNADALVRTVQAFEARFGGYMRHIKWLNLGGGHHITRADYDLTALEKCVMSLSERYGVQVYLEPGEAVVLNAGWLVSEVLEVQRGEDCGIAILDTSAACHMPDVLEMPYRPPVRGSGEAGEKMFTYELAGRSCLAGDVIGKYSFDKPLVPGMQVVFEDMALYTMVKTNTFNGVPLPVIALRHSDGSDEIIRSFGYVDFEARLS